MPRRKALKKQNNSKVIDRAYYFYFLIAFFPILAPYYFVQHEFIGVIIDIWMCLSIAGLFSFALLHYKKISKPILIVVATYILLFIVTICNNGDVIAVIKHSIKVILLCCVIDILKNDKSKLNSLLYAIRDITLGIFVINLLTCLVWKTGIPSITQNSEYPYHLYGNVNTTIRMILPGMLCSSLINREKGKKFNHISLIYLLGFVFIYFYVYPATTSLIAIAIITAWILLENLFIKQLSNIYLLYILLIFALELLIVIFPNEMFIKTITGLLNKSTDFTGRSWLWTNAMNLVKNNPIFGVGRQTISNIKSTIGNMSGSHNYYLDILYQRGIVGFVLFLVLILAPLWRMKTKKISAHRIYMLVGYSMVLLTMFLSEPFFEYECYFMPILYSLLIYTDEKRAKINAKK